MQKNILPLLAATVLVSFAVGVQAQQGVQAQVREKQPQKLKLVVNIVVGGISADVLERFGEGFSAEGFTRFAAEGTVYTSAHYGYMQTSSPAGLATLTTGVNPSMHGIASGAWIDHVTGNRVSLVDDPAVQGVNTDPGTGKFSPLHIVMPTLGDKLLGESPASKVISIASEPLSAIVAGGQSGTAYWMDQMRAVWVSSTTYMKTLPDWAKDYNTSRPANAFIEAGWTPARTLKMYRSSTNTIFAGGTGQRLPSFRKGDRSDYGAMLQSPAGNTLTADFARRVVENEKLGADDATDILNVCFDASRHIVRRYGSTSIEVEDMLYRLDLDLSSMVRAITTAVGAGNVLFVLTSDHGASEPWDAGGKEEVRSVVRDRFNVGQFKTLLGSFLGVQFGTGDWVLDYIDGQVYLNHNLIYKKNLSLAEVQNRAATFALQFRGVSHVLTSTALVSGYYGAGYGQKMQNSFYPRRGGDLMLGFMPGWIEERPDAKSLSGSMYDYDTHVPLMLFGWKIPARRVDTEVDMTRLAPTLARFIGINRPIASDGATLP